MEYKCSKFECIIYCNNMDNKDSTLYNIKIVEHAKDLGIKMSSNGTFRQHQSSISYCKSVIRLGIPHLQSQAERSNVNVEIMNTVQVGILQSTLVSYTD